MVRPDKRRSMAERVLLGFLASHYKPLGCTYQEIVQGTKPQFRAVSGREGLSLRQVIRHVSRFLSSGWASQELVERIGRFSITPEGYFYFHGVLEGRNVDSLTTVPKELLPPLMAKGIWRLTADQARYFREYLNQEGSLLVLLPAGAGKTLIATIEAYQHYRRASGSDSKVLYLSPYKAINSQSTAEFRHVLGPLGVIVARQDGDHHTPRKELLGANLVVSTFESAQSSLYRNEEWIHQIAVVIVDELTILDAARDRAQGGLKLPRAANLDLLITSFLHSFALSGKKVKFVCLGIPNANQPSLQRWFGGGTTILNPSQRFERCEEKVAVFEERVSGEIWFLERKDGVQSAGPFAVAPASDMQRLLTLVVHYVRKLYEFSKDGRIKPVLVFVKARKDASESAIRLRDLVTKDPVLADAIRKGRSDNSYKIRQSVVMPTSTVKQLSSVVNDGIGFHHAGLFHGQRRVVEQMMDDGSLSVLFATTTLTHGVDFPVGAVIIDAQLLRDILRYSRLEYLQLRGRVDHKDPFHETGGIADAVVVMTQGRISEDYDRIRELLQGADPPLDPQSLAPLNSRGFMFRALQYLTSTRGGISVDLLTAFASRSYYVQNRLQGISTETSAVRDYVKQQSELVVHWCERQGLISRTRKGFEIGEIGKIANQVGLGFFDMVTISRRINPLIGMSGERLVIRLLKLAISLVESSDEVGEAVPRIRLYERVPERLQRETERLGIGSIDPRHGLLVVTLYNWIEERPIPQIVIDKPEIQIYESGLLTSARAVARNLRTIAQAIEMLGNQKSDGVLAPDYLDLAEKAKLLALRVRYGVKDDIVCSELGSIASRIFLDDLVNSQGYPEFLMRIILRLMMNKGWSGAAKLRECKGKKPITAADLRGYTIDREAAEHLKVHRNQLNEVALRIIQLAKSESETKPRDPGLR